MTADQAAQLIAQNDKLLELYGQFVPLFQTFTHDVVPFLAVGAALLLGVVFGVAAT